MKVSAMARVTALMGSLMDLHVRLALQEANREKRRLISGGVFLGMGLTLLLLSLLAAQLVLLLWLRQSLRLDWLPAAALVAGLDLVLAGLSLRIGGVLLKGPYLPETTAGLMRTTQVITGRF